MNFSKLVFEVATPPFIPFSDKPLNLGGEINNIAIEEFEKRFNIKSLKEGISQNLDVKILPFDEMALPDEMLALMKEQVQKIQKVGFENLVVCQMGEVGLGVFASKEIPKFTVVCIYSGTIADSSAVKVDDEAMAIRSSSMVISTNSYRGIGSLMQHLPPRKTSNNFEEHWQFYKNSGTISYEDLRLNDELYSINFDEAIENQVQVRNLEKCVLNMNGIPVIAFLTLRDIKKGEQLGIDYNYRYWEARGKTPELFDINGNILPRQFYKRNYGWLNFDNFSFTGDLAGICKMVNSKKLSFKIDRSANSPEVLSVDLLSALLKANACELYINPHVFKLF